MGLTPIKVMSSKSKTKKWLKSVQKDASQELNQAQNRLKSMSWWKSCLKLIVITAFYFISSIALTFYQKDLIQRLPYPLSIVIVHLVLKFCAAGLCRYIWARYKNENRVTLNWKEYMSRVALVAVVSGLDIGLSQWSLEYVTLSLYTMTKTTSTPFILFFGLVLKLERKHWSQVVIVLLITTGLIMFTYKSTAFSFIGFIMVLTAAFFSGIRWTLSQLIMQKSKLGLENPIDFIFHIQPLMILTLLPIAIGVEGVSIAASEDTFRFQELSTFTHTFFLMTVGGLIAFCMEVAEFLVVTCASSLTLAIIGVFKEVTILTLAVIIKGNEITFINLCGMVICLLGIFAHVIRKTIKADEIQNAANPKKRFEEMSSSEDDLEFRHEARFNSMRSPIMTKEGLPLLDNDSEDSDEIDMKTAATKSSRHRLRSTNSNSDDNYLKETRTWTSVRDKHLQFKSEGPKTSDIFRETSAGTKNNTSDRGMKEEQIINLSLSDD